MDLCQKQKLLVAILSLAKKKYRKEKEKMVMTADLKEAEKILKKFNER